MSKTICTDACLGQVFIVGDLNFSLTAPVDS